MLKVEEFFNAHFQDRENEIKRLTLLYGKIREQNSGVKRRLVDDFDLTPKKWTG
jgi:hypothetical protein